MMTQRIEPAEVEKHQVRLADLPASAGVAPRHALGDVPVGDVVAGVAKDGDPAEEARRQVGETRESMRRLR